MYKLISDLIKKEHSSDMTDNRTYNQFYETNFVNTFKDVITEDLKELNKHLLDTQINYYSEFLSKDSSVINIPDDKGDIDGVSGQDIVIHSVQRNINLQNSSRFNYRIDNPCKSEMCQVEKVILPIEETTLFMCPVLIICLDTKYIDLHLRGTMKLGHRDYGIYTPFYESSFQLNSDKLRIQFKNQLFDLKKGCDVYKIESHEGGKLTLTYNNIESKEGEFLENDYIRICNFEGISLDDDICLKHQYRIKEVQDNKLMIDTTDVIREGLYVMNLSLQNSVHISYS